MENQKTELIYWKKWINKLQLFMFYLFFLQMTLIWCLISQILSLSYSKITRNPPGPSISIVPTCNFLLCKLILKYIFFFSQKYLHKLQIYIFCQTQHAKCSKTIKLIRISISMFRRTEGIHNLHYSMLTTRVVYNIDTHANAAHGQFTKKIWNFAKRS